VILRSVTLFKTHVSLKSALLARQLLVLTRIGVIQKPRQSQAFGIFNDDGGLPTGMENLGNDKAALKRHATKMRQEHATADSSGPCQLCHWCPPKWDVELRWGATFHTREDIAKTAVGLLAVLLVRHGMTCSHYISFNTHHALCGACYRR
jgi:hypothetical protein